MLALVGSGEYLPKMEPVDRFLLDQLEETPVVVCLPTAAGTEGEERIAYWSSLGVAHFKKLGVAVSALPVIDNATANNPVYADTVSKANFVYLSGGKPGYLYDSLKDSRVWNAIRDVHAKGGVLAGSSAGAMIMGEKFFSFTGMRTGFNILPGMTILPHFDEIPEHRMQTIRQNIDNNLKLIGIDSFTALISLQNGYHVMGNGSISCFNGIGPSRFFKGPLTLF